MSWKTNASIALTVLGLGLGATALLDKPTSLDDLQRQQQDQQVSDLSDAHERELGRHEDEAEDLRNAERDRALLPGERRPALPKLPLR